MACVINGVRPILLLTGTSSSNLRALYPARLCVAGTERGAVKCDSSPCLQSATRFLNTFRQLRAVDSTVGPPGFKFGGCSDPRRNVA